LPTHKAALADDSESNSKAEIKEEQEVKDEEMAEADADDVSTGVIEDEPLVAGGIAATLKLLAQKGGPRQTDSFVGRANDKKLLTEAGPREINLERLDSMGRPMTIKQAFREQSYKFHGKKPGKNKQEKRMKQYEEEKRRLTAPSGDTPLMTLQAMQNAQAKAGTPYIVLSASSIARNPQPSSPTGGKEAPPQAAPSSSGPVAFGLKRRGGPLPNEKRSKH